MARKKVVTKTTITEEIIEERIEGEKTQIICVLDRSGSMGNIIDDAIGGFNEFIQEQKKLPDEATLTVALFDTQYDLIYDNVDIKKVEEITRDSWSPRGMTALYDAIGKTINNVKNTHASMKKKNRPDKVLFCVVTDGFENSSREFSSENVKTLIKDCEKNDWRFIYLAANQDAFDVGTSFGFSGGNTYNFMATPDGAQNMSMTLSNASVAYRGMSTSDDNFKTKSKTLMDDEGVKEDEEN